MITEKSRISLESKRRIIELVGLSTDEKPVYMECLPQPSKEQYEANRAHYYIKGGKGYTRCGDKDSYAESTAVASNVNTSATVSVKSAAFLKKSDEPMEFVCALSSASKSVSAKDKSFTTASVTLAKEALFGKISAAGTSTFTYDGSEWTFGKENVSLADFGISVADGAKLTKGDKITVTVTAKWTSGGEDVSLSAYGVTVTGKAGEGDSFTIDVQGEKKTFYEAQQINGSTFTEMDTAKTYMFNEDDAVWVEQ